MLISKNGKERLRDVCRIGGHAMLPLEKLTSAASALILATAAHAAGWPFARGGSQNLTNALISILKSLGASHNGMAAHISGRLPPTPSVLPDSRNAAPVFEDRWRPKPPESYRRKLERFSLRNGIVQDRLGSERTGSVELPYVVWQERCIWADRWMKSVNRVVHPWEFAIVLIFSSPRKSFRSTWAPAGRHTGWGYCHVPNGNTGDMVEQN